MPSPGSIANQVPPGPGEVWDRLADLQQQIQTAVSYAASAQAVSTQLASNVAALAASGVTWAGPVASPSTVSAVGALSGASVAVSGNATVSGQIFAPNAFAASSGWTTAYFNVDGRLALGASALVFKQDFEPVDNVPLVEAILRLPLLRFHMIAAIEESGDKATLEIGLLADYLAEIGLGEFVYRDKDGDVLGINYDRLTVPLVATVQALHTMIKEAEKRLDAAGL